MPFFSIIIPTYNVENDIEKSIKSVLNQDFKDYEIIIVDGASTDNTLFIIKKFKTEFESLNYYSEKDNGIYDAMNKGIHYAKGKYLYFLGADDYLIENNILTKINQQLSRYNPDVLYGNVDSDRLGNSYAGEFTASMLAHKNIAHQSIFYNKAVFNLIGDFSLRYQSHADWEHNIKWFFHDNISKQFLNITIAYYSDGGYSSTNKDQKFRHDFINIYLKNASKQLHPFKATIYLIKGILKRILR